MLPLYGDEQALNWLTVIGPAGSLVSNVEDLIRYAQFHCNNGYIVNRDKEGNVVDTTVVMPRKAMLPLHRGYTVVSQDSSMMRLYGMCWFIEQNHDYKLYFHTGTSWGVTSFEIIKAGNNIMMPGGDNDYDLLLEKLKDETITRDGLLACASKVYEIIELLNK